MNIEFSDIATGLIALSATVGTFSITKQKMLHNADNIKTLKEKSELVCNKIRDLEAFRIKVEEALDRSYIRSEKVYDIFVEKIDYEKEILRIEKSIEKGVKSMEDTSERTLTFLQDILHQKDKK